MARSSKIKTVPKAPDGGYGWVVLVAAFFISFIVDGCMYSIGVVLAEIQTNFNVSQKTVNLLPSLNTGFLFCSGPIVSGLSSQFGIRPVIMVGSIITALVYVVSAIVPSIYLMMISYGIIGGISTGCIYIPSLIIIADYFDKKKGIATGIVMAGSGVGSFVFAPFVQYLAANYDWKFTLIILGCIILQCCFLGSLLKPVEVKSSMRNRNINKGGDLNVQTFSGSLVSVNRSNAGGSQGSIDDSSCCKNCLKISLNILIEMANVSLLKDNIAFLFVSLSGFFIFGGYFIPFLFIPRRAKELDITEYAWLLSIIGIVNIPARLIFGLLADLKFLSPINLNSICAILSTASLLLYFLLNTFYTQIIFSVLFAIGIGGLNVLATPYLLDIVGKDKFSNAMGILNLLRGIGCFIGPILGSYISEKTNSVISAFFYSGGMFALGTLFTLLISFGKVLNLFKKTNQDEIANGQ